MAAACLASPSRPRHRTPSPSAQRSPTPKAWPCSRRLHHPRNTTSPWSSPASATRSGRRSSSARDRRRRLNVTLQLGGVTEAVTVTATTPVVDVTNAITGQDITLQLTESLPTGRSYQSYLQLVPGVMPDDQTFERQPRGALGSELQRHWRHRRHFGRQRLLLRRHQRHRPGHGNVRREPQHRDHPGTARHHRRHSSRVRRRARPDLERRHQVGQQRLSRLGQLLLPEQRPDGRERERRGRGVLDQGQRLHVWRPDQARQGVVLRQLPLHQPRGRRLDARHQRVHAHGRQHAAPGLRQGQLGGDDGRPPELQLHERPDRHHRAPAA